MLMPKLLPPTPGTQDGSSKLILFRPRMSQLAASMMALMPVLNGLLIFSARPENHEPMLAGRFLNQSPMPPSQFSTSSFASLNFSVILAYRLLNPVAILPGRFLNQSMMFPTHSLTLSFAVLNGEVTLS
ncbi:MAG: hypothetical protein BWY79_00646 [Actinobacteria bacterium ADurb.Bin444]|nr:MAG: hypothetical protein BWY79_00646 [Actinobacteria bacterium ADurb.Bin444]